MYNSTTEIEIAQENSLGLWQYLYPHYLEIAQKHLFCVWSHTLNTHNPQASLLDTLQMDFLLYLRPSVLSTLSIPATPRISHMALSQCNSLT